MHLSASTSGLRLDARQNLFICISFIGVAMRILLTNDDGIYAPGLRAQRTELMKIGEVAVAAAVEGAFYHHTSIAVSLQYTKAQPLDFPRAAELARRVIEQMLAHPLRPGALINVNIPPLERGPVRGIRVVPQNVAPYLEQFDRRTDPRGRVYFWSAPGVDCPEPHPDTDEMALSEHYITVT